MKNVVIILAMLASFNLNAQALEFADVGAEPAYCRLFGYQSGNGVVYAAAFGGTPDYTYQWMNMETGATTSNTVWGGLNPGEYQIKVWDDAGDSIMQTVFLDSINPQASFDVISAGLSAQGGDIYWGTASVDADFVNTSTGFSNPNNPNADTTFFWQMTQFEDFYIEHALTTESYTYNYGGTWGVSLETVNKNGCSDVATAYIWLNGAAGLEDNDVNKVYFAQNKLYLDVSEAGNYSVKLFDLKGKLILDSKFNEAHEVVILEDTKGLFIVSIEKEGIVILNDKIVIE